MKPFHHFVVLMLTITMLALAITLPTTKSVQAARPSQSAEERIRATLEDAAESLGGGFSWESTFSMARPPRQVGYYKDGHGSNIPVYLHEDLNIVWGEFGGGYDFCEWIMSMTGESWTFHGMKGCVNRLADSQGDHIFSVAWQPQAGLEMDGHVITLIADSVTHYMCSGANADDTSTCGNWGQDSMDAVPLAEALHQAAIKNGLYEPMPEEILPATPEEIMPVDPGEVVPGQPGVPTDQPVPTDTSTPTETGGLFGIPLAVILGSLGIPVAGALAGAVLSAILSGLSSAGVSSAAVTNVGASLASGVDNPIVEPIEANDQGLYWSERPWDEAGPGYVSKEEYEQTKNMLEQGYQWTNGGWQTPDQIKESNQWQQNDRAATAREDAEWQAKMEGERQALEQRQAELKKTAEELQAASTMIDLNHSLMAINQDVLDANIYVENPYQGDPTLIGHGLVVTKNIVWDNTVGLYTGSNGMTCGEYVDLTFSTVKYVVNTQYGPEAKVQSIKFAERSTIDPRREWLDPGKYKDFFDRIIDDNHNLIKVTLPDGSEWAVDFHQHNTGNKPPILRPWAEVEKVWKTYLGEHEFIISTIGQ